MCIHTLAACGSLLEGAEKIKKYFCSFWGEYATAAACEGLWVLGMFQASIIEGGFRMARSDYAIFLNLVIMVRASLDARSFLDVSKLAFFSKLSANASIFAKRMMLGLTLSFP